MLETAFLSDCQALGKKQLQGLDTIPNVGFSASNLTPLGNLVPLTVTVLSSTDRGFQIGYDQIKFVLEKLKRDVTVTISPLEAVIAPVSDNSTDSFVRVDILSQQYMSVMGLRMRSHTPALRHRLKRFTQVVYGP
jgi:hypothetical protein